MSEKTRKTINLTYSIYITLFSIVIGVLFIVQTLDIYFGGISTGNQMYTTETISLHFKQISIPFILWIVSLFIGYVLYLVIPFKNKNKIKIESINLLKKYSVDLEKSENEEYINLVEIIKKERKSRKIIWLIALISSALCIIPCLIYLLNPNNFSADGNLMQEAGLMAVNVLPWFIIALFICFAAKLYEKHSANIEFDAVKKIGKFNFQENKNYYLSKKKLFIIRISIATLSIVLIITGIINGGARDVLIKAINICTECIGLG